VLYNHQQRPQDSLQLTSDLRAELIALDSGSAQFDLALHTWEGPGEELAGNWNYALDLFEAATVERLHQRFIRLLEQLLEQPQLAIGERVRIKVAAYPEDVFEGEIDAINPKVEDATRNLLVRAALDNPEGRLLPGMFADLAVLLPGEAPKVVVPETAITYTLYGNSVYVIEPQKGENGQLQQDDKGQPVLAVQRRFVDTGERREGLVVVSKGLQPGEQVVTAGQLKLDNGARVAIVADPQLTDSQPSSHASADQTSAAQ